MTLFFVRCKNESVELDDNQRPLQITNTVNEKTAAQVTSAFLGVSLSSAHSRTKDIKHRIRRVEEVREGGELLYYIYHLEPVGFVVVSANYRYYPVIAFSENSIWESGELGGVKEWMHVVKLNIRNAQKRSTEPLPEIKKLWESYDEIMDDDDGEPIDCTYYSDTQTERFIHNIARWNQGGMYKYYMDSKNSCDCDKRPVGCGPVAMAMVMRYHKYPNITININGDIGYINSSVYSSMPALANYDCLYPSSGYKEAAMLMTMCGIATSTFNVPLFCARATYPSNLSGGFTNMGYSNGGTLDTYSAQKVTMRNELLNLYPVVFSGTLNPVNLEDYHIWVGDGYRRLEYDYWLPIIDMEGQITLVCSRKIIGWIGMNWGWGGSNNGFFIDDGIFDTTEAEGVIRVPTILTLRF